MSSKHRRLSLKERIKIETLLNENKNKGREIDLIAGYLLNSNKDIYKEFMFYFVIEIKKEINKPWIVFTSESSDFDKALGLPNSYLQRNFEKLNLANSFSKYNQPILDRIGRTAFEGFSNGKDKLYSSLCNSTKAFFHAMNSNYIHKDKSSDKLLSYFEPMIILEGELLEATTENNKIELNEKSYIQINFNYLSPQYNNIRQRNIIHIVKKEYLEEYIDKRVSQFKEIYKYVIRTE
ncbi:hypothetical protein [Lutibacter sp. B1]|uniref:hypothetical protein n=1 Tax=Lutibacter sp. B1 TaxID=2725996 RepID=UPI0014565636|nr:hypothetical protein [Lutibacter sp. B1]NLP59479.1 hypothetical protein [Lutibacter sp. B1]